MKRFALSILFSVAFATAALAEEPFASPDEPHGMIDLNAPIAKVIPVRLGVVDGHNNLDPARTTFPLTPGLHELVVVAIEDFAPMSLQGLTGDVDQTDPGKFTIEIKEGIRYFIAAEATNDQGGWKPIIWNETYMEGPDKGKVVPDGD